MKQLFCISALLCMPLLSQALPAPAYLSVPDFTYCLAVEQNGSEMERCLPAQQQEDCPDASWQALLQDNIPPCQNKA